MSISFPVAAVAGGKIANIFQGPEPFVYGDVQHPATAWEHWMPEDWAIMCHNWVLLPVVDIPPTLPWTKMSRRRPEADWTVTDTVVKVAYDVLPLSTSEQTDRLKTARTDAIERINAMAGWVRARYLTMAPGQEAAYAAKETEARAYLANPGTDITRYPYLAAEARHTSTEIADVAAAVIAAATAWETVAAEIEGIRRGSVIQAAAAQTPDEAAACCTIKWPTPDTLKG